MSKPVLVTGGAGYIGSHTCLALVQRGWTPIVIDNYCNSSPESLRRVMALTGQDFPVIEADIRDTARVTDLLKKHQCHDIIHFAGLKAVGESNEQPLAYWDANVVGTHSLLSAAEAAGAHRFVFSSSATVYGQPDYLPLDEKHATRATNPYGQTKLTIEHLLADVAASSTQWKMGVLRYFNPVGAHETGEIGEDPSGPPNNLMPYIAQVAVGLRPLLSVFGDDYDTPDGTGVRDYIHVVDLAEAHIKALERLSNQPGGFTVNLGTGQGYSVFEMINAFKAACGRDVPHQVESRRAGDVASCYADPSYAEQLLNWRASRTLKDMCDDHWAWQSKNPRGYAE